VLAGAHDLCRHVVDDVEITREAGRIVRRVQQAAAGEMALLGAVGGEDREDVLLECGERHRVRSRAASQASWSP
jgi:hypothetical protein